MDANDYVLVVLPQMPYRTLPVQANDYHKLFFRLSELPVGTLIVTGDHTKCDFLIDCNGNISCEGQPSSTVQDDDQFPAGAVAKLPSGVICTKMGCVWIPRPPIRVPTPVFVGGAVPGHENYRFVTRFSDWQGMRIPFNMPLSVAATATFAGADDPVHLPCMDNSVGDAQDDQISVSIDMEEVPAYQVNVHLAREPMTKGDLAQKLAEEVSKYFGCVEGTDGSLRTYVDVSSGKEVIVEDLFLVDFVQVSEGAFQPRIALVQH